MVAPPIPQPPRFVTPMVINGFSGCFDGRGVARRTKAGAAVEEIALYKGTCVIRARGAGGGWNPVLLVISYLFYFTPKFHLRGVGGAFSPFPLKLEGCFMGLL